MPPINAAVLRQQIAAGDTGPLYLLLGDDDVEKSAVAAEFADLVEEELRAFNVERLYGGETKVDTLMNIAQTLPMMAPRRVVIVLEAEKLLAPKRESKAAEEEQERLEAFVQAPPPHATLVFVCGGLDMRRRIAKLLLKEAQVVSCGALENDADAERWVVARAARDGIKIDQAAVRALVSRTGIDLVRLRSGLERVALYAMGQPSVTVEDIRQAVPVGPEAQTDFGIANAIARGDAREALKELGLALDGGAAPFFVLGQIRIAAEKLPSARLRPGVDAVFRTDLALKSSAGDPRVLLERIVVELCGSGGPPSRGFGAAGRQAAPYRRR
jgi:DNA polymerase-3 subunit delta